LKTSVDILREVVEKLLGYKIVLRIEFFKTKVRAYLVNGYALDIYYNTTLGKYSYTVFKENRRILSGIMHLVIKLILETYPPHFRDINGSIKPSNLSGNPLKDLNKIMKIISEILIANKSP